MLRRGEDLFVVQCYDIKSSNITYSKEYLSYKKIKDLIYSPKIIDSCYLLRGRELDFKYPILKISFDRMFFNENLFKRALSEVFKNLKCDKYTVWAISIGGLQASFNEFMKVFRIVNGFKCWKSFLPSIRIDNGLKSKIETYLLLYDIFHLCMR